jgi:hypothetical protein
MKYNNFTFIKDSEPRIRVNGQKRLRAIFRCKCGSEKDYDKESVTNFRTKMCWECAHKLIGEKKTTHNLIKHPLYRKWQDMKKRCYNKKVDRYKSYGALGIEICKEWKDDFLAFYNWSIKNGWKAKLTIERKDIYKNYCPENCCFITIKEQSYNKKNTLYVIYNNEKVSLAKLCNEKDIKNLYNRIRHKIKKGFSFEEIIKQDNIIL